MFREAVMHARGFNKKTCFYGEAGAYHYLLLPGNYTHDTVFGEELLKKLMYDHESVSLLQDRFSDVHCFSPSMMIGGPSGFNPLEI